MEFLTIFLSSLIALVSPVGLVIDRVVEKAVRDQFHKVEELRVRVDNAPSYQILQGKAEKVRIAGRGVFPAKEFRIAKLEVETDPIDVNPRGRLKLDRPVQAAVRLVVTQADLNQALSSPIVTGQLRDLGIQLLNRNGATAAQRYDFLNPEVELLPSNRIRAKVELQEQGRPERLLITMESGVQAIAGSRLQFIEPQISVDGETVPSEILNPFLEGVSDRFDLRKLQPSGVTARLLHLKVNPAQTLEIAAFVRAETLDIKVGK